MKSKKVSLKDYWYAKPEDERHRKFLDKHPIDRKEDPAGNKDDVFNATNVKMIDRSGENHGYNPGEDEKVYEDLEEGKKTISNMGVRQFDSKYKKSPKKVKLDPDTGTPDVFTPAYRKKKGLSESEEQLDELSKKTLGSYIKGASRHKESLESERDRLDKASRDMQDHSYSRSVERVKQPGDKTSRDIIQHGAAILQKASKKADDKAWNRTYGIHTALKKLTKEETNLNELSSDTMMSYAKKARKDMASHSSSDEKVGKRKQGLDLAIKRNKAERAKPQYESVEKLDELSKKTLGSYIQNAATSLDGLAYKQGIVDARNSRSKKSSELDRKSGTRLMGIKQAAHKLTKESTMNLSEDKKAAETLKDLHKKMKEVHDNHHKGFLNSSQNLLKKKGFSKLGETDHHHVYHKLDSDNIHLMKITKSHPVIHYHNTNTGYKDSRHHDLKDGVVDLDKGIDKMLMRGEDYR